MQTLPPPVPPPHLFCRPCEAVPGLLWDLCPERYDQTPCFSAQDVEDALDAEIERLTAHRTSPRNTR